MQHDRANESPFREADPLGRKVPLFSRLLKKWGRGCDAFKNMILKR
jgi:hypothetical protein